MTTITKQAFEKWGRERTKEEVRKAKLDGKIILQCEKLNQAISPKDTPLAVELHTSKILSNTEEIEINNDSEIVDVSRQQLTGTIPKVYTSTFFDSGETGLVTPPTGKDKNIIILIITGVTVLITIGAGVIIIKKKVVK